MSTLNQGKVEREHEVSLSRLELNHDSLPTSKLAASDRLHLTAYEERVAPLLAK